MTATNPGSMHQAPKKRQIISPPGRNYKSVQSLHFAASAVAFIPSPPSCEFGGTEEVSSASPVHIKARERSGMWSSINPTKTRKPNTAERGCGSHSRSWKFTQLKHLTLLWSFTLYIEINLHHDFALLAQEPTLINQWSPATSWSCMNFDDQLQVTAGKRNVR